MSEALDERAATGTPRLFLKDVSKRFGGVQAIRHADFCLMPGEVHALVGENGAGKSTLIKIIAGAESSDTGSMELDGEQVTVRGAIDAIDLGIATVYQETQLFGQLTVAENIFLGREIRKGPRIDWVGQNALVVDLLNRIGLPPEYATRHVEDLSAAEAQQVAIAKALAGDAKILILDEPSAILTDVEIGVLYAAIRRLTKSGVSIIYITHRLDELFEIADVVTVMRDGRTLGTYEIGGLDVRRVAEMMVGGEFALAQSTRTAESVGKPQLVLNGFGSRGAFRDVELTVHQGEAVVLYGLVGSGVADIASAIYGMRPITSGSMMLAGQEVHPRSARQAQRLGLAMLPANRKKEGLFSFQPISFNISIGHLRLLSRGGIWMNKRHETDVSTEMIKTLSIKTPGAQVAVSNLSGGNAQKVVLARQLVERPAMLVLAEPTQGVDISAKEEIHKIIEDLCEHGTAVLVATSDLTEAMRIGDRMVVIRNGTTFTEFARGASQSDVLAAASGQLSREEEETLAEGGPT